MIKPVILFDCMGSAGEAGAAKKKPHRRRDAAEMAAHEAKKAADKDRRTREYEDPDNIWATFGTDDDDLSPDALTKSKVPLHPVWLAWSAGNLTAI